MQLTFVDKRLFVTILYLKDLFKPKIFGEVIEFRNIMRIYTLVTSFVKNLNLNTRIWTKQ